VDFSKEIWVVFLQQPCSGAQSATEKLVGTICFADSAIFHIVLIHIISNLNIRKNSGFGIRILKDSYPEDSIIHCMHA